MDDGRRSSHEEASLSEVRRYADRVAAFSAPDVPVKIGPEQRVPQHRERSERRLPRAPPEREHVQPRARLDGGEQVGASWVKRG